ncbi:hypothetical protein GCM10023063_04030 [Arthrobacter methylotrophus]|uniref:DUF5996 family protein n=1 Tax=Arthrobacter methylotrophus TaxID=121291 RepID=UPI0031E8A174
MNTAGSGAWPYLPIAQWQDTRDTLQLFTQIVGKVSLTNAPLVNHWWNCALRVTARGLSTTLMPHPGVKGSRSTSTFKRTALRL